MGMLALAMTAAGQTPGGVPANNLALWLKADAGTSCTADGCTVSAWADSGPFGNVAAGFNGPVLVQGQHNFNPGIVFNSVPSNASTNRYFDVTDGFANFSAGISAFVVARPIVNASWERFFDFSAGGINSNSNILFGRSGASSSLHLGVHSGSAQGDIATPTATIVNGRDNLTAFRTAAGSTQATLFADGRAMLTSNVRVPPNVTRVNNFIGRSNYPADAYFCGRMSEVVIFNVDLSAIHRQQVHSYLAAKYGFTLDQTFAQSYLASDGTTRMWDHSIAGASLFNRNITVIGRDDNSALMQKQSRSIYTQALVTVGHGNTIATTNAGNTNGFATDRSFLSFGDNSGAMSWTAVGAPIGTLILGRVWRAQEVGTVGSMRFRVPGSLSPLPTRLPTELMAVYLVVDADGNFTSGATLVPMTLVGTNWECDRDLVHGDHFTFATANNTTLPVELLDFSATVTGPRQVQLRWSTATEVNNDHFTVERSQDGTSWTAIGEIPGAGNSTHRRDYATTDDEAPSGMVLYRLGQTDQDGGIMHSPVVTAFLAPTSVPGMTAYPNPAADILHVLLDRPLTGPLILMDIHGRVVLRAAAAMEPPDRRLQLDLASLPAGTYLLRADDRVLRIVKR